MKFWKNVFRTFLKAKILLWTFFLIFTIGGYFPQLPPYCLIKFSGFFSNFTLQETEQK